MKIYIKHMFSTASDLEFEYDIDSDKKTIEIKTDWYDSSLFERFILDLNYRENINCVRDDSEHIGWTPYPAYKTFLTMSGLRFKIATHKLVGIGKNDDKYTMVLTPC